MASAKRGITIRINGEEVAASIKQVAKQSRVLTSQLSKMTIGSDEYNEKVKELRKVRGVISDHNREIRGVGKTWQKTQGGITAAAKRIGAAAVAGFAVGRVVEFGRELFRTADYMETMAGKAQIVFGDALPRVEAAAKRSAAAMGQTTAEYVAQAAAIGDLLIPMGFQRDAAADLSTQVAELGGVFSEWSAGQFSAAEAADAVGAALLGERERMKNFGISLREADISARLQEKGLDKLTGAMLQQAKAAATLELIMEKSVDAQAAYADGAGTMTRRTAELQARFKEVYEQLATLLIPVFEALMTAAGGVASGVELLSEAVQGFLNPAGRANEALEAQRAAVENLEATLPSLLTRYDQLKSKASLSSTEQTELRDLTAQIAEIVPTAVSEWGQYGDALDINTEKARRFIEAQKLLTTQKNADAIEANEGALRKMRQEVALLNKELNTGKKAASAYRAGSIMPDLTSDQISERSDRLKELETQINTTTDAIASLKGEYVFDSPEEPSSGAGGNTGNGESAEEKAAREAREALAAEEAARNAVRAAASRKREVEARLAHQEKLREIADANRQRLYEASLEEDALKLEQIARSYDDQLALAAQLEQTGTAEQMAEATALRLSLEQQREAELRAFREAAAEREMIRLEELANADLERMQAETEAELAHMVEADERKRELMRELMELDEETDDIGGDDLSPEQQQEAELQRLLEAANRQYDALREAAAEHNELAAGDREAATVNLEEIERSRQERLLAIQQKGGEEAQKLEKQLIQERLQAQVQTLQQLGTAFGTVADSIEGKTRAGLVFKKAATLAQIAFDSAAAITSAIAASSSIPFPGNIAAIATSVGTVVANVAQAKRLFSQGSIPQAYEGGYTDVIGRQDGRRYRARHLGKRSTGMMPGGPGLILVNERGPEYIVDAQSMGNIEVMDHVRAIEALKGQATVRQFKDGGPTAPLPAPSAPQPSTATAPADSTSVASVEGARELAAAANALIQVLDRGIYAILDDETAIALRSRLDTLDRVAGGRVG